MNDSLTLHDALDATESMLKKYAHFPNQHCSVAFALWIAHTYRSMDFYTTPRLALVSAAPSSGKTRALELAALLSFNARMTVSSTTAALFRRIGAAHRNNQTPPTILFDETDALFTGNRPSESTEQLRGIMNSGYKRGATVDRCEGDSSEMKVIEWPVFAPLALAGLAGHLPDTIKTRAIIIEMKKRTSNEHIAPYRERVAVLEAKPITEQFKKWASDPSCSLKNRFPQMPEGVEDRSAEIWESLLAIADQAGGEWPLKAREACKAFVFASTTDTPPISIELLEDIRTVMGYGEDTSFKRVEHMKTAELIHALQDLDGSRWAEFGGDKGLTPYRLSQMLKSYEVRPVTFRDKYMGTGKGYIVAPNTKQVGLFDAWDRYLKPVPTVSKKPVTTETSVTPQVEGYKNVTDPLFETVTASVTGQIRDKFTVTDPVTVTESHSVTNFAPVTSSVTNVTEVTGFSEGGGEKGTTKPPETDNQTLILDLLAKSQPLNLGAIMRMVKTSTGSAKTVPSELQELTNRALIKQDSNGLYTINERNAA